MSEVLRFRPGRGDDCMIVSSQPLDAKGIRRLIRLLGVQADVLEDESRPMVAGDIGLEACEVGGDE